MADTSSVELGDERWETIKVTTSLRVSGTRVMVIASMDAHPCQLIALGTRISRAGSGYFDDCALF